MVHLTASLIAAAAIVARLAHAIPMPDSSIGEEVGVSAPNGIPITDTAELASQTAAEAIATATAAVYGSSSYGSSGYGSSGYGSSGYSSSGYGSSGYGSSGYGSSGSSSWESGSSGYGGSESSGSSGSSWSSSELSSSSSELSSSTVWTSTSTTSAALSLSTSYGSGSSSWSNSGYDSCVQQCVASFGAPMATSTASSTSGSSGGGVTHTVIVAPTQGVLRYVPFATNASVGDTIKFVWHANVHTVTKSSQLEICNKTSDAPFASGTQNQSFVFTQVVNDTNPTFFYCGVPTHCQKGMFGILNPPSGLVASTSVASMMSNLTASNANLSAMWSYTNSMTVNNPVASNWGGSIDMASMPGWSQSLVAENVLYSRLFLASNPEVLNADGSINLGAAGENPLMVPPEFSAALAAATPSSLALPAATSSAGDVSASPAATTSQSSGARALASSNIALGLVAAAAAVFAL